MFSIRGSFSSILLCFFVSVVLFGLNSCKSNTAEQCANVNTQDATLLFNNETLRIITAEIMMFNEPSGDRFNFELAGVDSECNVIQRLSLNLKVSSLDDISNTYQVKDSIDTQLNEAYGFLTTQIVVPASEEQLKIASGWVTIEDNGSNEYAIDLDAVLESGSNLTLSL